MSLTARQLNRATLARQLLLRREALDPAEAVRRVVALQAQQAASPYLALWNRIAPFGPAGLDAALAQHAVVKAKLMRITLHAVHAADCPAFHQAMVPIRRAAPPGSATAASPARGLSTAEADALVPHVLEFLAQFRTGAEVEALLAGRIGAPQAPGLVGAADVRAAGARPDGRALVVRAPAGLPGLAGAARPGQRGGVPAVCDPALPDRVRPGVGGGHRPVHPARPGRSPGGPARHERRAGGVWRPADGGIEATAFRPLPEAAWAALAAEARDLVTFLAGRDPAVYRRCAHWWQQLPAAQTRVLPG